MKSRVSAFVTLALAIPAGLAAGPAALADTKEVAEDAPFVVSAEKLSGKDGDAGPMDLTRIGSSDWVHITGDQINRKNVDPVIEVEDLNNVRATGTLKDSPYSYTWSDGSPTEAARDLTTGGVYYHDATTGAGGYQVTIPADDAWRELRLVGGAYQSTAEISAQATSQSEPSYVENIGAGSTAIVKDYTILVAPDEGLTVTVKTKSGNGKSPNVSLAAAALSEVDFSNKATGISTSKVPAEMNLTELGTVDWLHLNGEKFTRKDGGGETITVSNRSRKKIDTQSDNPVRYSWTDGTPTATEDGTTKGGVFSVNGVPEDDPKGFDLSFSASDEERVVRFVAGAWKADADLNLYLGEDETPADTNSILRPGSPAQSVLFEIKIPAGTTARVTADILNQSSDKANVALGAVAVSGPDTTDVVDKLENLLADAQQVSPLASSKMGLQQLQAIIRQTEDLLAGDYTESDIEVQLRILQLAYDGAIDSGGSYTYESNAGLTSSFGWEGDRHAPIAYIDGSYKLRDRGDLMVTFGVPNIPGDIDWYNAEGYLPAFISEYEKAGLKFKIQSFSNEATIADNRYEIAYSRMVVENTADSQQALPVVSSELIPLNDDAARSTIEPSETVTMDWAIAADRFNGSYDWPSADQIVGLGSYDDAYEAMKTFWNEKVDGIASINELPNDELINAYKAGYIYTLIIRDDIDGEKHLNVGENGYDKLYDHDTIGIVASLLTVGDYSDAKDYLKTLPAQLQYDDAKWKYSWPFALYLQRTGDEEFIRDVFEKQIKPNTHMIETDRADDGEGFMIMKRTNAIDSKGLWTIDNWSALAGLTTYAWIADQLGETDEVEWANAQYDSLQEDVNGRLQKTIDDNDLDYIPMSMVEPNEDGPRSDPRDGNWASMFLFGRWGWDGYLFGADQTGLMIDMIDQTYEYGAERRANEGASENEYNFGGYPHGYFSSSYNAGYGSTALRGEEHREKGIRAYEFMLNESQSGPFGWWEGVAYPSDSSPWSIDHASGGGGSNQHMWGQSTATKVLFDSLIALKTDGTAIIGRGVPTEWIADGEVIDIDNYPVNNGGRVGYKLATSGDKVTVDFTGDTDKVDQFSIELMALRDNICSVDGEGAEFDSEAGTVTVPSSTQKVVITTGSDCDNPADTTAPTVTVKDGEEFTVGDATNGYELVSFKLFDEGKIDKIAVNGEVKDLSDNTWSDLNYVKPGQFGAVEGKNTLEVFDVAGNVTTLDFTLVASAAPAWDASDTYTAGDTVSHDGATWVAQWWTKGEEPGSAVTGAWAEQGALVPDAGDDVRAWTTTGVYTEGQTVAYDGHTWTAKWWNRNQEPGGSSGAWKDNGAY